MKRKRTHFGFSEVAVEEKADRVGAVFDSVVERYDIMNDLMSVGLHRLWKSYTVFTSGIKEGDRVLDLAGGTGDLAGRFARGVGRTGRVVLADINARMLAAGRQRIHDEGLTSVDFVQADAERLPFAANCFDCVCMGFGLRNVTDKRAALRSIHRVLRPGGKAVILEFSELRVPALRPLYDAYSFWVVPALGKLVANDAEAYRYLVESIRVHPDQDALLAMMTEAGFERCKYNNLTGGIVAVHRGYKT
jgi:demethylmenaquinone methyltransferase/2-methoxy-6-polyprenyl-1,4-benzoquinol methylase